MADRRLLEDGTSYRLLEDGSYLLLESDTGQPPVTIGSVTLKFGTPRRRITLGRPQT